jgi:hypothetical protein
MPRARNAIASTATRTLRIVTTRTPLFDEAGWREDGADLGEMKSGIFLPRNLDDPNHVEMAVEIRFFAQQVWRCFWKRDRATVGRNALIAPLSNRRKEIRPLDCQHCYRSRRSVGEKSLPPTSSEPTSCTGTQGESAQDCFVQPCGGGAEPYRATRESEMIWS